MTVAASHPLPWTVGDLYELPEDGMRHELLDGTLLVSPPPSVPHQLAARRLVDMLALAATSDVEILEAVGIALPAGLLVPDVVVARAAAVHTASRALDAGDVLAVAEVVSPSSKTSDRRWKPEAYAEAGIRRYLRVELDEPQILVFALSADGLYEPQVVAHGSQPVLAEVPFPVSLRAASLRGRRS